MYEKLQFTENTLHVLSLFTNDFTRRYHIREIERLLHINPRTVQLILENLENKGILTSTFHGRTKLYTLQRTIHAQKYLVFVEHYKAITFFEHRLLLKEIIEKIVPHIEGIGVLFGSYAKGTEQEHSDLDVFVAGTVDAEAIKKISQSYGIALSIKCYPLSLFKKNLRQDIFLGEILKNHIVFLNAEEFIRMVFTYG